MTGPGQLACPGTTSEVDALLAGTANRPVLLGGGTDLLVERRAGRAVDVMVDLTGLADALPPVDAGPGRRIRLSATAPIATIATDLGERLPGLRAAIAVFASPQIRNRASIGGNLGTASPAGDLMPPLVAADATVLVRGSGGRRGVPIADFLLGPRRTDLRDGEWIEAVDVVDTAGAQGFRKIGGRRALAISVVNLAWQWTIGPGGRLGATRLAVGAAAPTVIRCPRTEAILDGAIPSHALAERAAVQIAAELAPIDDLRGSAQYRRQVAGGLLTEALLPLLDDGPATCVNPGKETA